MEQVNNIKKEFDGYFPCVRWKFSWIKDENGKEQQYIGLLENNKEDHYNSNSGYFLTYNGALRKLNEQKEYYINRVIKKDHPKREEFIKLIQENSYIKGFNFKDMEVIK